MSLILKQGHGRSLITVVTTRGAKVLDSTAVSLALAPGYDRAILQNCSKSMVGGLNLPHLPGLGNKITSSYPRRPGILFSFRLLAKFVVDALRPTGVLGFN